MTNSSSAIDEQQGVEPGAELRRDVARRQRGAIERHFARAFGFAWPDCSRAAASLSRIT